MLQGVYWCATAPYNMFMPYLPPGIKYIKGQLERGETGYLHWQLLIVCGRSRRLAWIRDVFGPFHFELSRSDAADAYVWKDDTAVAGTRFELGLKPFRRNCKTDWDQVRTSAMEGRFEDVPSSVFVGHYRNLRAIASDFAQPQAVERTVHVFWGRTGTGKSRRAWDEAGMDAFSKDPRTKFWCGYRGQRKVVVDEFRGGIDIAHILRWCDRYPVQVEVKGASCPLVADEIWFTSNVDPRQWYPGLDELTLEALLRRFNIVHFDAL
jgi:hypothetical protein